MPTHSWISDFFDTLDKNKQEKLNMMEIKKGFEQNENVALQNISAKKFWSTADADGDKLVSKEEFYDMMQKVTAKGDLEVGEAAAAVKIQSIQRKRKASVKVEQKRTDNAATKIQNKARQKKAAADVQAKKNDQAAVLIQKKAREKRAKLEVDMKRIFKQFDTNDSGTLTTAELKRALKSLPRPKKPEVPASEATEGAETTAKPKKVPLEKIFASLDENGDGTVDLNEWIKALEEDDMAFLKESILAGVGDDGLVSTFIDDGRDRKQESGFKPEHEIAKVATDEGEGEAAAAAAAAKEGEGGGATAAPTSETKAEA